MTCSRVTKIRFHSIKIVLDQGLIRYLKKVINGGGRTFLLRKDNYDRNSIKKSLIMKKNLLLFSESLFFTSYPS